MAPFYNAGHTLNNIPGQGTAADSKLRQDTLLLSMEHWLFTQLKRNGVDNNITMNGPWKYDADIEQYCNSQSNLITIRIQDHFLGEVGMTRKIYIRTISCMIMSKAIRYGEMPLKIK